MARCCIPSAFACCTSFFVRLKPSSSEYSVCTCRCAKSALITIPPIRNNVLFKRITGKIRECQAHDQGDRKGRPYHTRVCMVGATLAVALVVGLTLPYFTSYSFE